MDKLIISPKTKVFELLNEYPQVEEALISLVPAFSKLKNPVLRKTIARVTSLQQAAIVGGIDIGIIINKMREIIGDDLVNNNFIETKSVSEKPEWFDENKIIIKLDAKPLLARGEHPVELVNNECKKLKSDEIFMLQTDFLPAPLIDMMTNKGFKVWNKMENENDFYTYFRKS